MNDHIHWHKLIAEVKEHVYYQCSCGHRAHGLRSNTRLSTAVDEEWVYRNADRDPR